MCSDLWSIAAWIGIEERIISSIFDFSIGKFCKEKFSSFVWMWGNSSWGAFIGTFFVSILFSFTGEVWIVALCVSCNFCSTLTFTDGGVAGRFEGVMWTLTGGWGCSSWVKFFSGDLEGIGTKFDFISSASILIGACLCEINVCWIIGDVWIGVIGGDISFNFDWLTGSMFL